MPRVSDIVGKAVVGVVSGQRLGRIADLILDSERERVEAVVVGVDWRSWFGDGRVLPFDAVQALGDDAVLAKHDELLPIREWREAGHSTHLSSVDLTGKPVLTADGHRVGTVKDALVDPDTGRLDQLEVTTGAGSRLIARRSLLPVTPGVRIGAHVVIVPAQTSAGAGLEERIGDASERSRWKKGRDGG